MDKEFGDYPDFSALQGAERNSTPKLPQKAAPQSTPGQPPKVQQPKPQALNRSSPSAILVSTRQKGNPIINHIKILPWEYADIPADYVIGGTTCALFLSLKYHRLHPEYIYSRIRMLAGKYELRVLLVMVDIPNHEDPLKELSKTSIINNLTLILCWSAPEAAHYLELFKSSEYAQPIAIRTQQPQSYKESLVEFVTVPRTINKSDAASLISTFGSLQNAVNAQPEQISSVPGWGEKKVRQWSNAVREDFRVERAKKASAPTRNAQVSEERTLEDRTVPLRRESDEHEEEHRILAESEDANRKETQDKPANDSSQGAGQTEEMSGGVMAALAKLRENGA